MTANLTALPAFSIPETGRNKEKVQVARVSSECSQGRKTRFGVLQIYVENKIASRVSDLINKRERDDIQKDYLKAQGPLCYFKLNPS